MIPEEELSRRRFVAEAAGAAVWLGMTSERAAAQPSPSASPNAASQEKVQVGDVDEFLRDLDPKARNADSPDGLICGDPRRQVRAVGTTWMASMAVLRTAAAKGINLIIAHEPTFWFHGTPRNTELKQCQENQIDMAFKTEFLARHGIAILRAHNCWDPYPKFGIEASLCAVLELPEPVRYLGGLHHLYRIAPTTLGKLAGECKRKMGLPCVRVSGEMAKPVERIVLAYGASSGTKRYYNVWKAGADAVISGEQCEWADVRPAIDMGLGVIEVGHSNSEAFGMNSMAQLLQTRFPGLHIEYLPTGDSFHYV